MSRIGKQPITIPDGVKIEIDQDLVRMTGKLGSLERRIRPEMRAEMEGSQLIIKPSGDIMSRRVSAFWGLTRTLLENMVIGVSQGYSKKLVIEGVGYRAEVSGTIVKLNVGYSNTVEFVLPKNVAAETEKTNAIILRSFDKELLGQTAAKIRQIRKPEPYKGKGIRYENEFIVRKAGKSGGKGKK
jgi:large subunit ribosomal protein L6